MFRFFRKIILLGAASAFLWWLITRPNEQAPSKPGEKEILVPPEPILEDVTAGSESTPQTSESDDDLTQISGIGPKISEAFKTAGITSYNQLAKMDEEEIRKALENSGVRVSKPESWPEQARFAAKAK